MLSTHLHTAIKEHRRDKAQSSTANSELQVRIITSKVLSAASYYNSHLFYRPVLQIAQHITTSNQSKKIIQISLPLLKYTYGMRLFLTRSRERFVCRCWSPRIHRGFCCSRRWLSRSPRVNIFGQRLSCGGPCWCCPGVNRSSWFGTCKKSQQKHTSVKLSSDSFPGRLISLLIH